MAEELICPMPGCRDMPIIQFNNSKKITLNCASHQNNNQIYNIKDYLLKCEKYNKKILCRNCQKNLHMNSSILYCSVCKGIFDEVCFSNTKCNNNSFHKKIKITYNHYFDKIVCLRHSKVYIKYCKNCKISFCEKCILKKHENHNIVEIEKMKKTQKEIDNLKSNLNIIEDCFKNIKEIVNEYLDEMENKIKMKKLILNNYIKNTYNGNSIENLDKINLSVNQTYKEKIYDILKKKDNEKLFSLNYFHLMVEKSNDFKNKTLNIKKELINYNKIGIKKEDFNNDKIENINNLDKKNFIEESENENNIDRSYIKTNHRTEFNFNEIVINNNKNNKILNYNQIDAHNYLQLSDSNNEQSKHNYKLEKRSALKSIINTIIEKSKIYSMTRLISGNLALGLSNGIIKIYNCDSICTPNNNQRNIDQNLLLTINQFKGRRINYIYQLKDETLLCCTFSKIHHIQLTNNDSSYCYIGLIKTSPNEISKKIIELGNDLIVCLSEKNYKKENLLKNKCILRVFKKENNQNNNSQDDSGILSDSMSLDSSNSSSMSSDWESLYSNEENEPLNNNDDLIMEDKNIKIYKKNKNYDKLYLCSIFGTKTEKTKEDDIIYEFIATSNKVFEDGENCVIVYGIMKKIDRHGYTFFIETKIDELPCSKMVNSISKLSSKNIAIALQKYNEKDSNGIAIIDMNKKEKIAIVGGFSIGIINREPKSRLIFYATNKTKDVNKCNQIRFVNDLKESLDRDTLKIVCDINTRFSGLIELKPNQNNKLFFYALVSDKALFVISINKQAQ